MELTMKRNYEDGADRELAAYYLAEVKKTPLLSAEQEIELARAIKKGSTVARDKLVRANLRLVIKIAHEYHSSDISLMDLIQEGNIGLVHAAEKFDDNKGARFSTYSVWWIRQSICRFINSKKRSIRLPNRKEETLRKINYTYHELVQKLTRTPTYREIANELNLDASEVRFLIERSSDTVSLDGTQSDDNSFFVAQIVEDYTYSPEENYLKKATTHEVMGFLTNHLPGKEKDILLYRYQLNGSAEPHSLKKIGERFGISPETVRQMELRALRTIKGSSREFADCLYA
jgi:RNA polymerase primary sigma factor